MFFFQQTIFKLAQIFPFNLTFSTSMWDFLSIEANELRKQIKINNGLGVADFWFNLKPQDIRLHNHSRLQEIAYLHTYNRNVLKNQSNM